MGQDDVDLSSQNGYLDANVGIGADSKWSRAGTSTLAQGNRKNLGFTEKPNEWDNSRRRVGRDVPTLTYGGITSRVIDWRCGMLVGSRV